MEYGGRRDRPIVRLRERSFLLNWRTGKKAKSQTTNSKRLRARRRLRSHKSGSAQWQCPVARGQHGVQVEVTQPATTEEVPLPARRPTGEGQAVAHAFSAAAQGQQDALGPPGVGFRRGALRQVQGGARHGIGARRQAQQVKVERQARRRRRRSTRQGGERRGLRVSFTAAQP